MLRCLVLGVECPAGSQPLNGASALDVQEHVQGHHDRGPEGHVEGLAVVITESVVGVHVILLRVDAEKDQQEHAEGACHP